MRSIKRSRRFGEKGFTLVEIIMAVLTLAIVSLVSMQYITSLTEMSQDMVAHSNLIEESKIAMEFMTRELREADTSSIGVRCGVSVVNCVQGTTYTDQFVFNKQVESPVDPLRRDTNATDITYSHNTGASTLERISGGITTTVAENVTAFSILEVTGDSDFYRLSLTLNGPSGETFSLLSATRVHDPALASSSLKIVLVVADPSSMDANMDTPVETHLATTLGHTVTVKEDDDQTYSPTDFDLIVISASVDDTLVPWLKSQVVGIFTLKAATYDEFELGTAFDNADGDAQVDVLNNTHEITSTQSLGLLTVHSPAANQGYIRNPANGVVSLADYSTNPPNRSWLLYVEAGDLLEGGVNTAAERRVFMGAQYFSNLNATGVDLFNRSVNWASQ